MNLRQNKQRILRLMGYIAADAKWQRYIDKLLELTPEEIAEEASRIKFWAELESKMSMRCLVEPGLVVIDDLSTKLQPAVMTYTVARKKDGEIVGTFDSLVEANEAIDKAKRAKKASLVLV